MNTYKIIIFLCVFALLSSCHRIMFYKGYQISIKNTGTSIITETIISSKKGFWFPAGVIIPQALIIYSRVTGITPNDIFTVEWKSCGKKYKRTLDLTKEVSPSFTGRIVFKIDNNNLLSYFLKTL